MNDVAHKERMIRVLKEKLFPTRFSWRDRTRVGTFCMMITYPPAPWGCEDICAVYIAEQYGDHLYSVYRLKFTDRYKNSKILDKFTKNEDGSICTSNPVSIVLLLEDIIKEYDKNEVKNMDKKIENRVRGLECLQFELKGRGIESSLYNIASDPTLSVKYPSKTKYTFCTVKEISESNDLYYIYDIDVVWPFNNCVIVKTPYHKSKLINTLSRWFSLEYVEILKPALTLLRSKENDYDTAYEEMKGIKKIKGIQYKEFNSKAYDAKLISTGNGNVTWCCDNIARYTGTDRIIKDVIFNDPATIVFWYDGSKTVVKAQNEKFDPEKGLAMAISKKFLGNEYSYYEFFNKYVGRYQKNKKNKKESDNGELH